MHNKIAPILAATLFLLPVVASAGEATKLSEVSHIHGLSFDAASPGDVLLATHFGIYRAHPDGTAEIVSTEVSDFMGFSPDPADAGRLLASGHPGQGGNLGVIVSTDRGVTWQKLSDGVGGPVDFHAMTISRADPRIIYGLYDGIQISRDGGATWTMAGPGPEKVIDLAASPSNADVLFAGTAGGLMQSTDAGRSWALIGPADIPVSVVETTNTNTVYAFFVGAGLFRQEGGGWAEVSTDFGDGYLLQLAADPADPAHLVAVDDKGAVLVTTDRGKTWGPFAK